ncbi:MAG: hypothetical protein ABI977_11335 [Acidobacteriota bacterium]
MDPLYLLFGLIITVWALLLYVLKSYAKNKASESGKTKEYEENQERGNFIGTLIAGLIITIVPLASLGSIPPGNEIIALTGTGIGVATFSYGLYKWHRFRQRNNISK